MYSFKIEGNSKEDIEAKLALRPDLDANPYRVALEEKVVRGFLGIGRKRVKYVAEYVVHEVPFSKRQKIKKAYSGLQAKQSMLQKNTALQRLTNLSSSTKQKSLDSIVTDFEKMQKTITMLTSQNTVSTPVPEEKIIETKRMNPLEEKFRNTLIKKEIERELVDIIIQKIKKMSFAPKWDDVDFLKTSLKQILSTLIQFEKGISINKDSTKRVILFVGPTGVGKTTSLVKCAADFFVEQKKMQFFTNDSYRVGAPKQLETYANILGQPFEVVKIDEINQKFESVSKDEVVFFDTAGRSQNNSKQVQELLHLVRELKKNQLDVEAYLVVSATTKMTDLRSIVDKFGQIDYKGILVTKTDETNSIGSILNILYETKKPVFYFAIGQDVPRDIQKASISFIMKYIID